MLLPLPGIRLTLLLRCSLVEMHTDEALGCFVIQTSFEEIHEMIDGWSPFRVVSLLHTADHFVFPNMIVSLPLCDM